MARWHSCNVLERGAATRRLWQFSGGGKFGLQREESKLASEKLSENLYAKDWQSLFQPKLNIAWLPADQVFLRVIQIPKSTDPAETQSMLELQLEKLSPLPVAQIVWSFELLNQPMGDMQTAIVIIVGRGVVEELLGKLESEGFLADRLELPVLDQLRATEVRQDGAYLYPGLGSKGDSCMVAWWYAGVLWNLSLLHLPAGDARPALLQEQLTQMAWAGEMEGWLLASPKYHVVADAETAAAWNLPMANIEFVAPAPPTELAARTVKRAVAANGAVTGLMPPEFSTRYRQRFYERIWMNLLIGVIALYSLVAAGYVGWTMFKGYQLNQLQKQVHVAGLNYTNTIQIKERVRVLKDQMDLQWAALDCYQAVAEKMPTELQLESLSFGQGRTLTLTGTTASGDDRPKVLDFMDEIRKVTVKEQPLFKTTDGPRINQVPGQGTWSWTFSAELRRTDQP